MFRSQFLFMIGILFLFIAFSGCGNENPPPYTKHPRLFLIGIDGATWDLIQPSIDRGLLPSFATIQKNSAWGELKTIVPTISPIIWSSMATGIRLVEKGFKTWEMDGQLTPALWRKKAVPFWEILDRVGVRNGIINWWSTYPATMLQRGWMITDRFRLGVRYVEELGVIYPSEQVVAFRRMYKHIPLQRVFGELNRYGFPTMTLVKEKYPQYINDEKVTKRVRQLVLYMRQDLVVHEAAKYTLKYWQPDFLAVLYRMVDVYSHFNVAFTKHPDIYKKARKELTPDILRSSWNTPDIQKKIAEINAAFSDDILPALKFMDDILRDYLENLDEHDYLLLVSDHGFRWRGYGYGHSETVDGIPLPHGFFAIMGPNVQKGKIQKSMSIYSIAPLILWFYDAPLSEQFVEKVPLFLFKQSIRTKHVTYVKGYRRIHTDLTPQTREAPGEEELREELKSLGYIQ